MKIRLVWTGKTKEKFASDAVAHYLRRLRALSDVEVMEIKEEKGAAAHGGQALKKEGERILQSARGEFILMDEKGETADSMGFARMLKDKAKVQIVLGGPYGVSGEVKSAAAKTIALSRMTLTHEMARIVALEQVYRALMINAGKTGYHH